MKQGVTVFNLKLNLIKYAVNLILISSALSNHVYSNFSVLLFFNRLFLPLKKNKKWKFWLSQNFKLSWEFEILTLNLDLETGKKKSKCQKQASSLSLMPEAQ